MEKLTHVSLAEIMAGMSHILINDPDIKAMCAAIDTALQKTAAQIPNAAIIHNLRHGKIPDDDNGSLLVDILAHGLHVDFYDPTLPFETRRELVANSLAWHMKKGVPQVIEEVVTTVFSDAVVEEWYDYGGWPYRFKAATEITNFTADVLHNLIAAIFTVKNTRSDLDYIEVINRTDVRWYAAIGSVQESVISVSIGDTIDTSDRPIVAEVFAGVLPEFDGLVTVDAPDALPVSVTGITYAAAMPEFDGYIVIEAGQL